MTRKGFRIYSAAVMGLLLVACVDTADAQVFQRFFGGNAQKTAPQLPPEVSRAFRPSDSDLEAAKNLRKSLMDTERMTPQTKPEPFGVSLQEAKIDESTPQVVTEVRFIECTPQVIAPKGMLPEQGWVLLPTAQNQKAPALRVRDLVQAEETPLAVGALSIGEQYTPALARFIDTGEYAVVQGHLQGDSRSNILMAPKITTYSGQRSSVSDLTERYFGWNNSKDEENADVGIFEEGFSLAMLPEVADDGSVDLKEFRVTFSQAVGQEEYPLAPDGGVVLTMPTIQTRTFKLAANIPPGKTLLVAVPQACRVREEPRSGKAGDPPSMMCLAVTCQTLTPEMIAENATKIAQRMYDSENMRQAEEEWVRFMTNDKSSSLTLPPEENLHLAGEE